MNIRAMSFIAGLLMSLAAAQAASSSTSRPTSRRPQVSNLPDLWAGMTAHRRWVMGTLLHIAIDAPKDRANALLRGAFAQAAAWDKLLSDYQPNSALSQLNRAAGSGWQQVSPRFYRFLQMAQRFARITQGSFDITIGALTLRRRQRKLQQKQTWMQARKAVGWRHLQLQGRHLARLEKPGMRLDAGGIGKGIAVDAIIRYLRSHGVKRAWVDFGGSSFYALGTPQHRSGWPILLRAAQAHKWLGLLFLKDGALSVSQSLRLSQSGHPRTPHILSPLTGRFVRIPRIAAARCLSATAAEVLSTALIVRPTLWPGISKHFQGCVVLRQTQAQPPQIDAGFGLERP